MRKKTNGFHLVFTAIIILNLLTGSGTVSATCNIGQQYGNISGMVSSNGTGISGVVVSDGREVTTTGADGMYLLVSNRETGYVFISIPGNYEAPLVDNMPQFFKRIDSDTGRVDFELTPVDNEHHVVLAFADIQIWAKKHLSKFSEFLPEINSVIDHHQSAGTKTYIVTLGDLACDWAWQPFKLTDYVDLMKNLNTGVFNCIGNHDHHKRIDVDDWGHTAEYRKIIGPTYYSFNLGKAHYVVLDNFIYTGDRRAGGTEVVGITPDQIAWLKKDLETLADKSVPLVVLMHSPMYGTPSVDNTAKLRDYASELFDCLAGFSNVHVLTGDSHCNRKVNVVPWLFEHNTGAACAHWRTSTGLCPDGTPPGFGVYEWKDTDVAWYYKSFGHDRNYQFRTTDLNNVHITPEKYAPDVTPAFAGVWRDYVFGYDMPDSSNRVLINIWDYDPLWTVEVTEGSVSLPVTRVSPRDPLHVISVLPLHAASSSKSYWSWNNSRTSTHFFEVTANSPNSTLNIKVTDRFGNVYTETMIRPKEFNLNMK